MDAIAAVSTGHTLSAVGILRISGEGCFPICDRVFRPLNGRPFSDQPPREMVLGSLLDREGRTIDQVLAVRFPGPRSYTGEDCAELHCHGSPVVLDQGLRALFAAGARQAGRGEFTKRAFLNGCLDLTQAEAVIDRIESETAQAPHNSVVQLGGALRRRGERALLSTADRGQILRQGAPTAILGRPNVGKSSLLNALLGYERAIVTDVAGTTRDTVEEKAVVGGVLLRLIDTAGIRDAHDAVERLGVERSRQAAAGAALALLVLDGSQPLTEEDRAALEAARQADRMVALVNKSDLPQVLDPKALAAELGRVIPVSARSGAGLEELAAAVADLFPAGEAPAGHILTNARQTEAAGRAAQALAEARRALSEGFTPDAVLSDTERAVNALGELTGRTLREDLTARIFERFCVGK